MNSNADDDQLSNTYQFVLFVKEGPWAYLGHFVQKFYPSNPNK